MVSQVLDQVARGLAWESISERWEGKVTKEAIAEAVHLSSQAFLDHAGDYVLEPTHS
jgi:heme oxygenase